MNANEQAEKIYGFCVDRVNAGKDTLTYGQVLNALGYDRGMNKSSPSAAYRCTTRGTHKRMRPPG